MTMMMATTGRHQSIFSDGQPPLNVHVEGNSISANYYTSIGTFDNHLMTVDPLASAGALHSSTAVSGASWGEIAARAASVDAAWRTGYTNVLVINETINSIYDGTSVAVIKSQIEEYLTGRMAAHPWRIIYWLCLPYGGSSAHVAFNAAIDEIDSWVVANRAALGIEKIINPRVLPIFDHDGTTAAPFEAHNDQWQENAVPFIHPLDTPKLQVAELIVGAMTTMRP